MASFNWKKFLLKLVNQLVPVVIMMALLGACTLWVPQRMPGFKVADYSHSHPIVDQTMTTAVAAAIMLIYPFCFLVLHCMFVAYQMKRVNMRVLVYWWDKTWCAMFIAFFFLTLSEFLKRYVGGCRPNFFAMCQPVWEPVNNFTTVDGALYVTEYNCSNTEDHGESARSFPSGHSLFAVYLFTATALLLETHNEVNKSQDPTWATRVMLQLFLTGIVGPALALTRYTEYYHHWWDVLIGIILGYIAVFLMLTLERVFVKDPRNLPHEAEHPPFICQ